MRSLLQQPPLDPRPSYPETSYRESYDRDLQGSRAEVISRMDQEIKTLERNYEVKIPVVYLALKKAHVFTIGAINI
jgi:hypothetical protein